MRHPRLTSPSGQQAWLAELGPTGSWGDLSWTTRWGDGPCGMYEASWQMPLPADFDHPLLRRGTFVEIMDGPYRIGSPLILAEPARGTGYDDPWQLTATGIGSEVTGENSFYADDGAGNTTAIPSTAATVARTNGWAITSVHSSVPAVAIGTSSATEPLNTVGVVLSAAADKLGQRWGVDNDNVLRFYTDPTTPTWQVVPDAAALGVADDDYASVVKVRYVSSVTGLYTTAVATNTQVQSVFRRRETPYDATTLGAITPAAAQAIADNVLARSKGRLGWTNGLTVTSNELLSIGGVPADLSMVEAGQMIRLHGIFNDLLEYNGQTWLDIIAGEVKYVDGAQTVDINPLGLAARDLAAVFEEVSGVGNDAA